MEKSPKIQGFESRLTDLLFKGSDDELLFAILSLFKKAKIQQNAFCPKHLQIKDKFKI